MTTWQDTIDAISKIITETDWHRITSPEQTIKLIEAKACLMNAKKKIEKAIKL